MISGSTRLKSGTAQKLVLNMFSTITMIRLGKTYGSLMIDVAATNEKLRERAVRIVQQITDAPRDRAAAALESAGGRVSVAVVMLERDVDSAAAASMLEASDGRLRTVLEEVA